MTYYLAADSTRVDGKRVTRGAELPDDVGARLAEKGLAVTDLADLRKRRSPTMVLAGDKADERSTVGVSSPDGVDEEESAIPGAAENDQVTPVTDSTGGAKTTTSSTSKSAKTAPGTQK